MVLCMNSMIHLTDDECAIKAPRVTRLSKKHCTPPYSKSHNTYTNFRKLVYFQNINFPGAVHPIRWHIRTKCQMYSLKLWLDLARTRATGGGVALHHVFTLSPHRWYWCSDQNSTNATYFTKTQCQWQSLLKYHIQYTITVLYMNSMIHHTLNERDFCVPQHCFAKPRYAILKFHDAALGIF